MMYKTHGCCTEQQECCCENHGRKFLTEKEKIEKLEKYREWLQNEAKGVEEAISRMKKAS